MRSGEGGVVVCGSVRWPAVDELRLRGFFSGLEAVFLPAPPFPIVRQLSLSTAKPHVGAEFNCG